MKKAKITLLSLYLLFSLFSYGVDYQIIFSNKTEIKENYVLVEEAGFKKIIIPFHYNKTTTGFNESVLKRIAPKRIRSITYVYNENNNLLYQKNLNNVRIDALCNMMGKKLKNVDLSLFSTVILSNKHTDKSQFTGFVITLELNSKENLELMKLMMNEKINEIDRNCFSLDTLEEYGYILPHFYKNLKKAEYKIVPNVFTRNNEWKNKLIVVDVTGSMTPYLSQYLLWLKLNFDKSEQQHYVFFNDGNDYIKDYTKSKLGRKIIGATGGIYFAQNTGGFDLIKKTITIAMRNGGGGDCPENNIEALIAGEKKYKNAKEVIMIADNNATPRDMELLKNLNKPIRIILCGVKNNNFNEQYLSLAYKTKGSLHTIELDLKNLKEKKEGDRFQFGDIWYIIKNGEVVLEKKV